VNSRVSKERNFAIVFRNLEHVLFCKILWKIFCTYGTLRLVNWPVFSLQTSNEASAMLFRLSKVYFHCECAYFRKTNFKSFTSKRNFEINF